MKFGEALSRISEIHDQLAKGEVYRGLRSVPIGLSAACGFLGVAVEGWVLPLASSVETVLFWCVVAAVSGVVGSSELLYSYLFVDDPYARRRTRRVVGQFVPSLAAGAAITWPALQESAALVPFLPGAWALLFGLGVFASRPYLPRAVGWVGLYYLAAGAWFLSRTGDATLAVEGVRLAGWEVGGTFGCGQAALAVVLYWNLERREPERRDDG
jgi:hypothetical protein